MTRASLRPRTEPDLELFLAGERANPRRGAKYDALARAFIRKFPPDSILDDEQFAAFLEEWGAVPVGAERIDLSVWSERLRNAGSHPRMPRGGNPSFTVRSDHAGRWIVLSCAAVIRNGLVLEELRSFSNAQQAKLRYAAEGVDVSEHSPIDVRFLKLEFQIQIETFKGALMLAQQTAKQIEKLAHEMAVFGDQTPLSLPLPSGEQE